MRTIIILLLLCSLAYAGTGEVITGYGYISENGKVISKIQREIGSSVDLAEGQTYTEVANVEELTAVELFKYRANDLIEWGMTNYPAFIGTPHEYVLLAFANDPSGYKDLLLARATILDTSLGGTTFTDTANALIAKAQELGAVIE
jgi:hypothetical protein